MAQQTQIVTELKRALKEQGLTYAAVARRMELSIATVKRLFAGGDFSLRRIDAICDLLGLELSDILERAQSRGPTGNKLTLAQERMIVADPKLLLVTWLVVNRTRFEEIIRDYDFTERELQRYLIKLDRLAVIALQPMNRVRLLIGRRFSWRPGGPVQRHIQEKLLVDFLESKFSGPGDELLFYGGAVSSQSYARLQRTLQECRARVQRDHRAGPRTAREPAQCRIRSRPTAVGLQRLYAIHARTSVNQCLGGAAVTMVRSSLSFALITAAFSGPIRNKSF
jgi:transcriptional regulator with XRE-family HTH domain